MLSWVSLQPASRIVQFFAPENSSLELGQQHVIGENKVQKFTGSIKTGRLGEARCAQGLKLCPFWDLGSSQCPHQNGTLTPKILEEISQGCHKVGGASQEEGA